MIGTTTSIFAKANYIRGTELKGDKLKITFKFPVKKVKHFMIAKKGFTKHIYDIEGGVLPPNHTLPFKHKNVKSFRIGQYNKHTLRIVIETTKGQGAKHYINSKVLIIPMPTGNRLSHNSHHKRLKKKKNKNKAKKLVILDAGHGGKDNGASDGGVHEKKITLQISYRVKKLLEKMGYKVYMTRTNDRYISLLERTKYANSKNANIFVSIHVNASPKYKKNRLTGIETYYLSSINSHIKKNNITYKGKVIYTNSLFHQMTSLKKRSYSKYLAKKVEKQISKNIRKKYGSVVSRLKCADYWVLTGTKIPSILVEAGYVTHKKDRKRLLNSKYQNLIAKGIADGINSYFYGKI